MSRHRTGTRSNQRKRGLIRRVGIVFPVTVFAPLAVIAVAIGAKIFAPGSGAFSVAEAVEAVPGSHTMALLEAEREQLIAMTAAARTLTVVAKPKLASPADVATANPAGSGTGTGTGTGGIIYVTSAPPDPNTAQSIAYNMMGSFGFSPTTYFGCLLDLWNRESGWVYDAENASGAYGIPQALPGSKMASAGADWETNPATQIRWGLGYIKGDIRESLWCMGFRGAERVLLTVPETPVSLRQCLHRVISLLPNVEKFDSATAGLVAGFAQPGCLLSNWMRSLSIRVSFIIGRRLVVR